MRLAEIRNSIQSLAPKSDLNLEQQSWTNEEAQTEASRLTAAY